MEVQVEESNNHKEKSKEKIENGSKYEMTFVVPCGMIMLLGSEYNIFELVGCVIDLFIIRDLIVSLYVYEYYVVVDILKFYEFYVIRYPEVFKSFQFSRFSFL